MPDDYRRLRRLRADIAHAPKSKRGRKLLEKWPVVASRPYDDSRITVGEREGAFT
jgi:hypothetical protein